MIDAFRGEGPTVRRVLSALCLVVCSFLVGTALVTPPATGAAGTPTAIAVMIVDDLSTPVAGRPTDFTATLVDDQGHPVAGQPLRLWTRSAGSATFEPVVEGLTDD